MQMPLNENELARLIGPPRGVARKLPKPLEKKMPSVHGPVLTRLADVTPEAISWIWPKRIAIGKLGLIIGDPGLGKSFLTLDIASRVSAGTNWPDDTETKQGDVILLSAEDGIADTIRPRIDSLNGCADRIHVLEAVRNGESEKIFSLATDIPHLEMAIEQTKATLVIIDPISAYLGKTDSYKDGEVRGLLGPLAALAAKRGVAILGVMHLTKDAQRQAIYRAPGSIGFVGAARIVMAVAKDPDDEQRRLFMPVKSNLSSPCASLAFNIENGVLQWEPGPVTDVEINQVLAHSGNEDRNATEEAIDWLVDLLGNGPMKASDVQKEARQAGIGDKPLRTARERVCKKPHKKSFASGWWWELRDSEDAQKAEDAQDAYREKMGILGVEGHLGELLSPTPEGNGAAKLPAEVVIDMS